VYYIDQWIRDEILEEFVRLGLPGLERITIHVFGGLVKLEGLVPSVDIRRQYTDVVLKIDGVVSLLNKLKVMPSSAGKNQSAKGSKDLISVSNPGSYEVDK
jgi:osmotically-inducible protein OsmY